MSTTITAAAGSPSTTSPLYISGYDADRKSRNVVHDLIGGGQAVVLTAAPLRSGRLRLAYSSRANAFAAVALHARATTYTIADTDLPQMNMSYIVAGGVSVSPEDGGFTWIVSVDFQEV